MDVLDTTIRDPEQAARALDTSVIGTFADGERDAPAYCTPGSQVVAEDSPDLPHPGTRR